jgi:RHS repeat-associated protein
VFGGRYLDEELLFDKDTNNDGNCTDSGGSVRYLYCQNANWNVVALTDNTGAAVERVSYTAYGQPTVSQVGQAQATGNPFLFQGQRYCPETGLYYFKNRDYLPTLGRLVQRDREGDLDSFNVYELEQSAPVFYLDPTGLTTILVFPQLGWSNEKLKSDRQGWTALGQTKAYIFVDSACLCVSEGTQHSVHAIDPKSILVDIFVFIVMNKGEYKDDPTTGELVAQVPSWEGGDTKNPTTIPHTLDGDYGHEVRHENMIAKCVEANRVKWIGMFDKRAKDLGKCTGDGCCEKNQQVLNAYIVRIITNAVEATGFGHAGKHGGSVKDEEGLGYPVIDKPYPDEHYAQELGEPPNMTGGVEIPAKPE